MVDDAFSAPLNQDLIRNKRVTIAVFENDKIISNSLEHIKARYIEKGYREEDIDLIIVPELNEECPELRESLSSLTEEGNLLVIIHHGKLDEKGEILTPDKMPERFKGDRIAKHILDHGYVKKADSLREIDIFSCLGAKQGANSFFNKLLESGCTGIIGQARYGKHVINNVEPKDTPAKIENLKVLIEKKEKLFKRFKTYRDYINNPESVHIDTDTKEALNLKIKEKGKVELMSDIDYAIIELTTKILNLKEKIINYETALELKTPRGGSIVLPDSIEPGVPSKPEPPETPRDKDGNIDPNGTIIDKLWYGIATTQNQDNTLHTFNRPVDKQHFCDAQKQRSAPSQSSQIRQ